MQLLPGELSTILFGYSRNSADGTRAASAVFLYRDGTLTYEYGSRETRDERKITFLITEGCLRSIEKIISDNLVMLRKLRHEINRSSSFEYEKCFIFDGMQIIDWDLTRWYLEEDRKKHPEYYSNSLKVELTENYVRGIFDEICLLIERDEKRVCYTRAVLTDL